MAVGLESCTGRLACTLSDMTFVYNSGSDSYELDVVNDVPGHLHIPDTFNNGSNGTKNVTVIGQNACSPGTIGHKNLVSLCLPSSLTTIENDAFRTCRGLTGSLTIPEGVTSIGNIASSNVA